MLARQPFDDMSKTLQGEAPALVPGVRFTGNVMASLNKEEKEILIGLLEKLKAGLDAV